MNRKIEKYFYILSPILILVGLFYYYITRKFETLSIVTIAAGVLGGILFFIRFYDEIVKKITKRKIKYGVNSLIITVVVLALVVIAYMVLMDHNKRIDLTKAKRFSLSEQTIKVLEKIKEPVNVYAFYAKHQDTTALRDLLEQYHYYNKKFNFEFVDPDLNPSKVKEFNISEYGQIVVKYGDKVEKASDPTEEGITNALIKLTQKELKTVYFVKGHGEKSIEDYGNNGYDRIAAAIRNENYKVKDILLIHEKKVPDDCAVLIIAGPVTDYEPYEIKLIENYVNKGGRVIVMLDPSEKGEKFKNLVAMLRDYGLIMRDDVIIDPLSKVLSGDYFMPVVSSYTYNPITKNFRIATFLKLARSVEVKSDSEKKDIFTRVVARTAESSWAETNLESLFKGKGAKFNKGEDIKGPVPVIAYARKVIKQENKKKDDNGSNSNGEDKKEIEGYVMAFGDSDFVTNSMYQTQGNKDLFLNSINYLANRGEMITIRPKQQESVYLTLTSKQGRIVFFVMMLLIPLSVIVVGLYINIQRRVKS